MLHSILIIDDNETDRELLIRLIKKAGIAESIHEADDGQSGLDYFKSRLGSPPYEGGFPSTLIFLDINMPRVDGFRFLEEFATLRENYAEIESAVLTMFSSSEREEDKQRAFSFPFVKGFVVKMPRSPEELKAIVLEHFP